MQTTTNIGLKTYEANDPTDWLGEFNYNMNKIDTAVGTQNDAIEVIEETASTAVTTANTASTTASEALTTVEGKTSVNDNVASATTTYSSNKINELISGIQPGTEIDDTVTSTTKTWSSSKINTQINTKASINDTTAGATITYSSNKINDLLNNINTIPYTLDTAPTETTHTLTVTTEAGDLKKAELTLNNLSAGYYYIRVTDYNQGTTPRKYSWTELLLRKNNTLRLYQTKEQPKINEINYGSGTRYYDFATDLIYIPENTQLIFDYYSDYFLQDTCTVKLIKVS